MGSSKKKGQQRKAAKKALSAAAERSSSGGVSGGDVNSSSNSNQSKIVAKISSGDNKTTKRFMKTLINEGLSSEYSGALSAVLDLLKRCENETFHQVMNSVGGDLKSPSLWIQILATASFKEPSYTLQIVENIGPLVRCMVNDTDRLLFKSNKDWRQGIVTFVNLSTNVTDNLDNDSIESGQIIQALLKHDGLLRSIIQWGFWNDEHRPDIVKDLKSEGITTSGIVSVSRGIVEMLVNEIDLLLGEESRNRLFMTFGTTPIVSKEYDSSCMVSYTAGLARRLKTAGDERENVLQILQRLIRYADCVDKGVIIEIIDLGTNYTPDYESATSAALLFLEMIHVSSLEKALVNDTRVAFAIREGSIEMCLGFIERFGEHESVENEKLSMCNITLCIFQSINKVSLHKKTAKAIRHQKRSIEEKLLRLEEDEDMSKELLDMVNFCSKLGITNYVTANHKKKKALDTLRSIINLSGRFCCRCNKSLSKTEVMECNGCTSMAYCSRACQKKDWLNSHKLTCNNVCTSDNIGMFQGRILPKMVPGNKRDAEKLEELEKNITMNQLNLFLDHSDTILSQAKSLDIPLCDCVVRMDLRHYPPTVALVNYTVIYDDLKERKSFEETRSKENITCVYYSMLYRGEILDGVALQRVFPLELLMKKVLE